MKKKRSKPKFYFFPVLPIITIQFFFWKTDVERGKWMSPPCQRVNVLELYRNCTCLFLIPSLFFHNLILIFSAFFRTLYYLESFQLKDLGIEDLITVSFYFLAFFCYVKIFVAQLCFFWIMSDFRLGRKMPKKGMGT